MTQLRPADGLDFSVYGDTTDPGQHSPGLVLMPTTDQVIWRPRQKAGDGDVGRREEGDHAEHPTPGGATPRQGGGLQPGPPGQPVPRQQAKELADDDGELPQRPEPAPDMWRGDLGDVWRDHRAGRANAQPVTSRNKPINATWLPSAAPNDPAAIRMPAPNMTLLRPTLVDTGPANQAPSAAPISAMAVTKPTVPGSSPSVERMPVIAAFIVEVSKPHNTGRT